MGLNLVGLSRRGLRGSRSRALKQAYRLLFRDGLTVPEAVARIRARAAGRRPRSCTWPSSRSPRSAGSPAERTPQPALSPVTLRIGVIGVGALGRHHVRTVSRTPGAPWSAPTIPIPSALARPRNLVAAPSRRADPGRGLRRRGGRLLDQEPPRGCRHRARAGKHCLVEKPLADHVDACEELSRWPPGLTWCSTSATSSA